jgi:hypothetical protein
VRNRSEVYAGIDRARQVAEGEALQGGVLIVRAQRLREFEAMFGYEGAERLGQAMHDRLRHATSRPCCPVCTTASMPPWRPARSRG